MKLNNVDQNDLLDFLENQCQYNDEQLQIIQEYKNNPTSNELLTWFAQNSIFNQILSRALLNEDFHRIFLFHSFLTQLHSQLQQNQPTSLITIYRSQIISYDEMKLLKNNINQFISLNSSFFGVADRTKALDRAPHIAPALCHGPRADRVRRHARPTQGQRGGAQGLAGGLSLSR